MKDGQWYPGSMAKAIETLRQDLKIIDLVIELLDARIPISSRNPAIAGLLGNKKHLHLLHKADRAEEAVTERWLSYYRADNQYAMPFSVYSKKYLNQLISFLKKEEDNLRPSRIKRPLRMMFVGIPNVGKSTLINFVVKKAVTRTANQPGITRGRQWIRLTPGLELLDTPGVLWPRIADDTILPLAVVGAMPPERIGIDEIVLWLIQLYLDKGRESDLLERYKGLKPGSAENIFQQVGLSQGCLISEGKVDPIRTAGIILRDFQNGSLGRFTIEEPPL